jgi:hypothetical protein
MANEELRERVRAAVEAGHNARERVAALVAAAAEDFLGRAEGLVALTHTVLDGAADAVKNAVPQDAENRLRQVVDGLGDGLSRAAVAAKLTLEEASGQGRRFARDELEKLQKDLRLLGEMFVETVRRGAAGAIAASSAQASLLKEHAARTLESVRPSLRAALDAARGQLASLASDAASASLAASRQAAGGLFTMLGRSMQRAGEKLKGEKPPAAT